MIALPWLVLQLTGDALADAFFYPAQSAIVPHLVKERDLPSANALVQGTAQLSLFVGPMLAGGLIALFANGQTIAGSETIPALRGIGLAFAIDAATFLASAVTLWFIKIEKKNPAAPRALRHRPAGCNRHGRPAAGHHHPHRRAQPHRPGDGRAAAN